MLDQSDKLVKSSKSLNLKTNILAEFTDTLIYMGISEFSTVFFDKMQFQSVYSSKDFSTHMTFCMSPVRTVVVLQ
jgi:hypothetical protein